MERDLAPSTNGFVIDESPKGRTLVVTGDWTIEAAEALRGEVDGLTLNYARGYHERDLAFLDRLPVRRLNILARTIKDLTPVYSLADTLEELDVEIAPGIPVDLDRLPLLKSLGSDWDRIRESIALASNVRQLIITRYEEPDISALSSNRGLISLELKQAPALESLSGVAEMPSLSVLRVILARRLKDLSDLMGARASLQELKMEDCPAVEALDGIEVLKGLRFLGVSDCGVIKSLRPVAALDDLQTLYAFGSTRIADGDLSPLLNLPNLVEVRMRERPEYKPSVKEVKEVIAKKKGDSPSA